MSSSTTEKTGYEASDIIEDALQLAVDEELKDVEREDVPNHSTPHSSKVNMKSSQNEVKSKNCNDDQKLQLLSPPRPESAPVVAPLTIEDKINMDTSKLKSADNDDTSLIVHLDDTQSDLDLDVTNSSDINDSLKEVNDNKSIRKSINESNNSMDSKSESNDNKTSNSEELSKDSNKLSEKESSKSKSSNTQKDSKIKTKDSKNASAQKELTASGRNIWVSGLLPNIKAFELQSLFCKHGKVVSAKIIKNAKMTGSRCYGFITMENPDIVSKCINQLNKTEIHSKTITLSRNRPKESTSKSTVVSKGVATKRVITKSSSKDSDNKEKSVEKSDDKSKSKTSDDKSANKTTSESESNKTRESKDKERKPIRAPIRDRVTDFKRTTVPFRRPQPFYRPFNPNTGSIRGFNRTGFTRGFGMTRGSYIRGGYTRGTGFSSRGGFSRGGFTSRGGFGAVMTMNRPDVDRHIRERERERRIREERRHREELMRVEKDMEREERIRFEREKDRLKLERMKLEREKAEFFRVERERAKLEREKIEREREELRRRQQSQSLIATRVDDTRSRPTVVTSLTKRPFDSREDNPYWEERKRLQQMQRTDNHLLSGRPTYTDSSPSPANRHTIPQSYNNRNDSYKRNPRLEQHLAGNNSRQLFDIRRQDARHGVSHDRDDRKAGTAPSYYNRDTSRNTSFTPRDRKTGGFQRDDWKTNQYQRRSDRYSDKAMTSGSNSGVGTSRYGTDSRNWSDRSSNSINKLSYASGGVHVSSGGGSQQWTPSSGNRWNSAHISSSNDSRNRGQPNLNSGAMISSNPSISHLYTHNPMPGMNLGNLSHSMASSANMSSNDRYINNRRF